MPKRKAPSRSDYTLKRRFINKFNEFTPWQDIGHGEWLSLEDVQDKIKLLVQNYKIKHVDTNALKAELRSHLTLLDSVKKVEKRSA